MKKHIIILLILSVLFLPAAAYAKHLYKEKVYRDAWCNKRGGTIEYYIRGDYTHVDCLLDDTAVEVEFAPKFYEAIGQSLYYALMTQRKAGVLLIMENDKDDRFLKRLKVVADFYNITVWTITPQEINNLKSE